jgi:hypothetical protein
MILVGQNKKETPLQEFCLYFFLKQGMHAFREPESLAEEFRKFFAFSDVLRLNDLKKLAPRIGIASINPYKPASKERGAHAELKNDTEVLYKYDDWSGSQEHTIGHELREIIGKVAKDMFPDFKDAEGEELENEADAFSAALLMEKNRFYSDMIVTGLDPIALKNLYNKSYIAVISRMATVFGLSPSREFIWGSICEYEDGVRQGFFRAKCFHRSPRYIPRVRYRTPNFLFPKRGQLVPLQGNLLIAKENKKAVFIRRLIGLDFWNAYSLSVIIRPVIWNGETAKLIVVAIPEEDSYKFRPQLRSTMPITVAASFQII